MTNFIISLSLSCAILYVIINNDKGFVYIFFTNTEELLYYGFLYNGYTRGLSFFSK